MKFHASLLLSSALALLAFSPLQAQSIVGAWSYGDTLTPDSSGTGVIVFLNNGAYFHAESENDDDIANGEDGIERGTYSWNSVDTLTLISVPVNTNGQWGLSHDPGVGNTLSLTVSGDTLTIGGDGTMSRVTGASPIVGAWTYGNTLSPTSTGTGALVFLANGAYFHMESDNVDDIANGPDDTVGDTGLGGMERGTYSWDSGTNTFTLNSVAVNTNGQWGLSHDPGVGVPISLVVSGDTLVIDGFTLTSVSAIPEPSTYAMFAGLGALGLVIWRRRQKTA